MVDGVVSSEICYLSAIEEGNYNIAKSDINIDDSGKILDLTVPCRYKREFTFTSPGKLTVDLSSRNRIGWLH